MKDEQRRAELAHFLRTRRERLSPAMFHLPYGAKHRRTPGLRREELAQVAGISPTWYMKLEQGQAIQVSAQVLESLAQSLQLTPGERNHLYLLAREQLPLPMQRHTPQISEELQGVLDALTPYPAFVVNERWDVVGWNLAASQVFADFAAFSDWERNLVWIMFTQPDQRALYVDWECWAQHILALFRASGGREADEDWFIERRDRLMQASSEFREWWQWHEVGDAHTGNKELNHPLVGPLVLRATTLLVADDPNLKLFVYTPLPQADTAQKLVWLVSPAHTASKAIE
ncbi:XRE family transcriptional regulator [Ktedonosporobacter rubrisoli]|uniref:XRE family transcriptional regulator n=1 Tax=Ktedonosporobacter rubrisoli TaxID=2509675 RepID=A0A4P6JLD8_KTERU|nr:helix-turn-helix transcriptional regulator [Ktedonosporobacter rubrisoli]QBD76005.1 XRE family transcriptional regulator [Ktedonosporobacter rubrisoli]